MATVLYYDCFAGISGDMNLGALVDLGVDREWLRAELRKLPIGSFELEFSRDSRRGIGGTKATVVVREEEGVGHRHFKDIAALIKGSTLAEQVKATALKIFTKIAQAEAKVHGVSVEKVHFHEVGAIDSIVDVVGAALCLDYLKVEKVWSAPVQLGGGLIKCAHGTLPVPAPATAEILLGIPSRSGAVPFEATTPTGAGILAATVDKFCEQLQFVPTKIGYGIGQRDSEVPNVLRVFLLEVGVETLASDVEQQSACLIECNIDDMNPELYEGVMEALFDAGAQDVFFTPIIMKKSRPAVTVSVICEEGKRKKLEEILLLQTSTFGVRRCAITKSMLRREFETVDTEFGPVCVKRAFYGGKLLKSKVEYQELKRVAEEQGLSVREVREKIGRV